MSDMPSFFELTIETNESFLLGEESFKVRDVNLRRFRTWRIAKDGVPHPQICAVCGRVVKRWPTSTSRFVMRRQDLDISYTYDGFLLIYDVTLGMFNDLGISLPVFGFWKKHVAIVDTDNIPVCEVDVAASGVRIEDWCTACNNHATVLRGRTNEIPPSPRPLVISSDVGPNELRATDLHFGSSHGQSPILIVGHELWKGIEEWEF